MPRGPMSSATHYAAAEKLLEEAESHHEHASRRGPRHSQSKPYDLPACSR